MKKSNTFSKKPRVFSGLFLATGAVSAISYNKQNYQKHKHYNSKNRNSGDYAEEKCAKYRAQNYSDCQQKSRSYNCNYCKNTAAAAVSIVITVHT